jgi:nucleotide-binding universal stress UspA family protein
MKLLDRRPTIALKNILFATDFETLANRALPFAVELADRYGAKLYAAHVIPQEAYAFARPESVERIFKEAQYYAGYRLSQVIGPLQHEGRRCETLLGEGDPAEAITEFARAYSADLIVVGTNSRAGLGKLLLGSVAEEIIRDSPCPVLTVGPHVTGGPSAGIQSIVCATDFSAGSVRAAELAASLAREFQAHLTLTHVVEGILRESPHLAMELTERRLREMLPAELELQYEPEVLVEIGPVAERLLDIASDLSADVIVMGVRGVGAFAQRASHFGSIAHRVVSQAKCPVLTVDSPLAENDGERKEDRPWSRQQS